MLSCDIFFYDIYQLQFHVAFLFNNSIEYRGSFSFDFQRSSLGKLQPNQSVPFESIESCDKNRFVSFERWHIADEKSRGRW